MKEMQELVDDESSEKEEYKQLRNPQNELQLKQKIAVEQAHPFKEKLVKAPNAQPQMGWSINEIKTTIVKNKDRVGAKCMETLKETFDRDNNTFWLKN